MDKLPRESDGSLPSFAFPGGYAIRYYTEDGGMLCSDCANGKNGSDAHEDSEDKQWRLIHADAYWEGPSLECDHCGTMMDSEYGDPDSPDDS